MVESSNSNAWGPKLEKKLKSLADSASNESIQTIAIYVGFNRKHSATIAKILKDFITSSTLNQTRQWLFWQIINELLLAHHSNAKKYDKYLDLRTTLGDTTVVPAIKELGSNIPAAKIEPLLKEWNEHNVFSSPTLVSQIKKMLISAATATSSTTVKEEPAVEMTKTESSSSPKKEEDEVTATTKVEPQETSTTAAAASAGSPKKEEESTPTPLPSKGHEPKPMDIDPIKAQRRRSSLGSLSGDIEYDFESKNVPQGKVDSREFLDPCKAIATLQIARDLRNDTAVQLSSLLSTIPDDIKEEIEKNAPDQEWTEEQIHDFSMRMPSKLLDLDIDEQIQTITTFQNLIQQQMTAREKLIHLLLKSRCHFGSEPAAKFYFDLQEMMDKLGKRKQLLGDALELEGLDAELDTTDFDKELKELHPLSWYKGGSGGDDTTTGDDGNEGSAKKKAKLS